MTISPRRLFALVLALGILGSTLPAQEPERTDPYGDALPAGALARLGTTRWRQTEYAQSIVCSGDGKLLVVGSQDGIFRAYDLASGKEVHRVGSSQRRDNGYYYSPSAISPDGRFLAVTGGLDKTFRVWELAGGKELWKQPADAKTSYPQPLAFAADGRLLATRDMRNQKVQLWETATGKELGQIQQMPNNTTQVTFAPDGSALAATGFDGLSFLWEVPSGKLLHKLGQAIDPKVRGYGNFRPVFSGDGKLLTTVTMVRDAAAAKMQGTVTVWEVHTGKEVRQIKGPEEGITGGFLAPAGDIMAWIGLDSVIHLQDLATGKKLHQLGEPTQVRYGLVLVFSPDGKSLFVSRGRENRLFDVPSGKELWKQENVVYSRLAAFLPDSKGLALVHNPGREGVIRLVDAATGKDLSSSAGHQGAVSALGISADGKTVTTRGADNTIRAWEAATGKELRQVTAGALAYFSALSADGRTAVVASTKDGVQKIEIWDVNAAKAVRELDVPQGRVFGSLVFAPDGKTLAARGTDQLLRLYDTATGKEQAQIGEPAVNPGDQAVRNIPGTVMLYSADGTTLATTWTVYNNTNGQSHTIVYLWQVSSGKQVGRLQTPNNTMLAALAFSPDGRTIATLCRPNGNPPPADSLTISLWEAATGKERCRLKGGAVGYQAAALAFSADGRVLASSGADNIIRLWSVRTGKELGQFAGHQSGIASLVFAADGQKLLSGSADTTALIWDAAPLLRQGPAPAVELTAPQLDSLWAQLAGADGTKAFQAINTLSAAPNPTLDWFKERLKPAVGVDEKRLALLIADLSDEKFAVRERAAVELEKFGDLAEPALRKVMDNQPNLDLAKRVQRILDRLEPGRELPPDVARVVRAIEVLEQLGTPEVRQFLQTLAEGAPGARLTREAQAALKRSAQ